MQTNKDYSCTRIAPRSCDRGGNTYAVTVHRQGKPGELDELASDYWHSHIATKDGHHMEDIEEIVEEAISEYFPGPLDNDQFAVTIVATASRKAWAFSIQRTAEDEDQYHQHVQLLSGDAEGRF